LNLSGGTWVNLCLVEQSEKNMGRKFIDCRAFPSEMNCSIAIGADSEAELLEAAVQHAVAVHKHQDTPDLRQMIKSAMKDGTPSIEPPHA
jgi:predicted small metal-binding protein